MEQQTKIHDYWMINFFVVCVVYVYVIVYITVTNT